MDLFVASFITNILDFFIKGGLFMFLLLALSVVAGTIMILRASALRYNSVLPPAISDEIESLQPGDSLDHLQGLIRKHPSPLSRVLATLIQHLSWPRSEVIEAVQTRARHEVARMERGLVFIEIATGIAPLLGLLGTLSGLVSIFSAVGADPAAVARGIAEALNTTMGGLAVAVPCLVAFSYFQRRIEVMAIEMESLVAELVGKCYPHGDGPTIEKL